jgi:phosphopantothenoylcysteine decarboxylase/phosphopantothenate--cysteine ligase
LGISLKNKRILITAGPTWVPIDSVRVISNTATGETGILLAERLVRLGARVTLLLGPAESCCLDKRIRIKRFRYFEELQQLIIGQLRQGRYDIAVHSAAVSDYRPLKTFSKKVPSGKKRWQIALVPTPKLLGLFKRIDPVLFVVGFKFEPEAAKSKLIREAKKLLDSKNCDAVIANMLQRGHYRAYIVRKDLISGPLLNKEGLVKELVRNL